MTPLESEFENIALSLTPPSHRFDVETLSKHDERLKKVVETLRSMQQSIDILRWSKQTFELGTMPAVYLDFTTQETPRAFVEKSDHYFIGVSIGMIVEIQEAFLKMVMDPNFMPQVEDRTPPLYTIPFGEYVIFTDNPDRYDDAVLELGVPVLAKTERELLAERLTNRALQFVVLHELAHIRNGHFDMVNDLLGKPAILDMGADLTSGVDELTRQALEMDADSWASVQMICQMVIAANESDRSPLWWHREGQPVREAFVELAVCIPVLFMTMMRPHDRLNVFDVAHPPAFWRLRSFLEVVATWLLQNEKVLSVDEFLKPAMTAFGESIDAFSRINERWSLHGVDLHDLQKTEDELFFQSKRIIEHWGDVVLLQLQPFTHVTDLPGPQKWSNLPPQVTRQRPE